MDFLLTYRIEILLTALIFTFLGLCMAFNRKSRVSAMKQTTYGSLFEQNLDGILLINRDAELLKANNAFSTITGYTIEELKTMKLTDYIRTQDLNQVQTHFSKTLKGQNQEFPIRFLHKNRHEISLQIRTVPFMIENRVDGVYVLVKDITAKLNIQRELYETVEQLEAFFNSSHDAIDIVNMDRTVKYVNPAFEKMFDWKKEEITRELLPIIPEDIVGESEEMRDRLIRGEYINDYEAVFQRKDGTLIDICVNLFPLLNARNEIYGIAAITRDISEQKQIKKSLSEKEEKYRLITEYSTDLIRLVNKEKVIMYASPSHANLLGFHPEEMIGKELLQFIASEDLDQFHHRFREGIEEKKKDSIEFRLKKRDGSTVWVQTKTVPVFNEEGVFQHFISSSRDISAQKGYEEELKQMAFYDSLTGIPNRRLFYDRLSHSIRSAGRNNHRFALLLLDCDRFKWVNDTFGHDTGDELLKKFVQRAESCIRQTDTIARLGGDEFAIILDRFDTGQDVGRIANRLITSLQKPWIINGREFTTTSSIGISIYPNDGGTMEQLITKADQALYLSKEKGRNQYHFYTSELASEIERTIQLEDELKKAIDRDYFHLVYQPQVNIAENKMAGAEVLLRFTHPVLGPVSPVEFIPLCEKIGIIDEVTYWVMREAFKQQKEWEAQGYPVPLAINISPATLEKKSFLNNARDILREFGTDPHMIEFELTEDTLLHDMESISGILEELQALGIRVSLDDFGTGYSSLKYMKELPIDKIKIDRSFMIGLPSGERERAIFEGIFLLTKRLGAEVLCEGVETQKQLLFLQKQGCRLVQGYYYSKPLKKEEFKEILRKKKLKNA